MIPRRVANLTTRHTPSVLAAALLVVSIWASTVAHVSAQITPVTVTISHRPIIVAMFRGDVNQTALENTYKKYLTPSDYVFNTLGADQAKIDALPGQKLVGGGLVNQMDGIAKQNQGKAQWIVYDLE